MRHCKEGLIFMLQKKKKSKEMCGEFILHNISTTFTILLLFQDICCCSEICYAWNIYPSIFFSTASKPLFNSALWAVEVWPLKRLRESTVIHAAFNAENWDSKNSSIPSYLLRTLSSLMGSLATLLIECYSGQHQS